MAAQTALEQIVVVEQAGATEVVAETVAVLIVVVVLVVTTGAAAAEAAEATAEVDSEPVTTSLATKMGSWTSPGRMKNGRLPIGILRFSVNACL